MVISIAPVGRIEQLLSFQLLLLLCPQLQQGTPDVAEDVIHGPVYLVAVHDPQGQRIADVEARRPELKNEQNLMPELFVMAWIEGDFNILMNLIITTTLTMVIIHDVTSLLTTTRLVKAKISG